MIPYGYEYKGYRYEPTKDYEEDNIKIFHDVVDKNHFNWKNMPLLHMDWSPYSYPTESQFRLWVELGRPARIGCGPLDHEDLISIAERTLKNVAHILNEGVSNV